MRLYISYAQNDALYCMELVECLHGVHEVWYDERGAAGSEWREGIRRRLHWCEAFLYLLSAESLASRYCQDEYHLVREAQRLIFLLQIESGLELPEEFRQREKLDFSDGLNAENQRQLLNALLIAERNLESAPPNSNLALANGQGNERSKRSVAAYSVPIHEPETALQEGIQALNRAEYDNALFLFQQVQASGQASNYVDLPSLLARAEGAQQAELRRRQAERQYAPIRELVRSSGNRELGCQAFAAFQQDFPQYDPDNLAAACAPSPLVGLLWCDIPAGEIIIQHRERRIRYWNEAFRISQYPITNAQYQAFIDASDGYGNERWWRSSAGARAWRQSSAQPARARFPYPEHPRENVNWFEAIAFCEWLSELLQFEVRLPSEQQWQRAAQGDDERIYPWGSQFRARACNSAQSQKQQTTAVDAHAAGSSPYGVQDMAGNTWEWCENEARAEVEDLLGDRPEKRIVRGGSFLSAVAALRVDAHQTLTPQTRAATVGFRIVALN